jgi:hypothetical protein
MHMTCPAESGSFYADPFAAGRTEVDKFADRTVLSWADWPGTREQGGYSNAGPSCGGTEVARVKTQGGRWGVSSQIVSSPSEHGVNVRTSSVVGVTHTGPRLTRARCTSSRIYQRDSSKAARFCPPVIHAYPPTTR